MTKLLEESNHPHRRCLRHLGLVSCERKQCDYAPLPVDLSPKNCTYNFFVNKTNFDYTVGNAFLLPSNGELLVFITEF